MLMKICKCGRRIPQGQFCDCQKQRHKIYDDKKRDKSKQKFYASAQWRKITETVKARAKGLDEYLLAFGIMERGTTAHHIYTIEERPDLKAELDNLIFVSAKTHNKIHAIYSRSEEEKTSLQKQLSEMVRLSWRADREKLLKFPREKSAKENA